MNIADVLQRQATCRGEQPAIVDGRRSLTFSALNDETARAASALAAAGLRANDRALIFCPMSVDLYVTLVGIFRLGAVAVFVDPSAGRKQIAACCDQLEPRGFVAVRRAHALRMISARIRRIPVKLAVGGGVPNTASVALAGASATGAVMPPIEPRDPESPALITFTSGSTGTPKAAVRSHGFLLAQHGVLAEDLELRAGEIDLATLPVFVLANLASGVTSVIPNLDLRAPAQVDAAALVRQIRSARASRTAASPSLLDRLADHLAATGGRLEVARIFTGGAPVFPALLDRLASVAPHASITAVYGSTEAEPIATVNRDEITEADRVQIRSGAGLLAGMPVSSTDLRILPDRWGAAVGPFEPEQFEGKALPSGRVGEIVVSGPHVLRGYLNGRGDEETKICVGSRVWHRTGDAGYRDASGRLWLMGRCSARVRDTHGTLYPFAVECAASDIPGVRRTAFVSYAKHRVLVVELSESREDWVRDECHRRLGWAHLDRIITIRRIPVDRRHNAKVDYPALERLLTRS